MRRTWLAVAGLILMGAAPPLNLISRAAFYTLWYTGLAVLTCWAILEFRNR